jgi:hypothetical protein
MRSVGWAFAWETWQRHRLMILPVLAYLLALIVLFHVAPAGAFAVRAGEPDSPAIGLQLSAPLVFAFIGLLILFLPSDEAAKAHLEARESGFPRRLFTLPLRTAALAGWPLGLGGVTIVSLWVVLAEFVWRPCGVTVPLLWPPLCFMAFLAWVQALMWWPFPLPFLRLILAVPMLGLLAAGAVLGCFVDVSEWILASVSAALVAGGYGLAVAGVARARRGEGTTWLKSSATTRPARSGSRPPFASASQALFWIVWRRGGYGLPLMIGLLLPIQLGMLYFADFEPFLARQFLVSILATPFLMAAITGTALGYSLSSSRNDRRLPAFTAARPITTTTLVAAHLRVAVASTLMAWVVLLVPLLSLLPFTQTAMVLTQEFGRFVESQGVKAWELVALLVVVSPLLTWRLMVDSLWLPMTGRKWLTVLVITAAVAGFFAIVIAWHEVSGRPELRTPLLAAIPWVLGAVVALKMFAGVCVARALLHRGLVAASTLARFAIGWGIAALTIVALAFWLTPAEIASPWTVACLVILALLPMVRLGLAPLALDWNRHR